MVTGPEEQDYGVLLTPACVQSLVKAKHRRQDAVPVLLANVLSPPIVK